MLRVTPVVVNRQERFCVSSQVDGMQYRHRPTSFPILRESSATLKLSFRPDLTFLSLRLARDTPK